MAAPLARRPLAKGACSHVTPLLAVLAHRGPPGLPSDTSTPSPAAGGANTITLVAGKTFTLTAVNNSADGATGGPSEVDRRDAGDRRLPPRRRPSGALGAAGAQA